MARRIKETIQDAIQHEIKMYFLNAFVYFHNICNISLFLHLFMLNSAEAIVLPKHFERNFRKINTSPHDWRISLGIWELLSCFTDHAI